MSNSTLFLCFYGDGPYWKDLLYIPAYPAGFSYQKWAFRYDPSKWVSSELQADAAQQKQKKVPIDGILGVRFSAGRENLLLPLRKIEITWIDLAGGITQFYFRVQALLDFTKYASLEEACLTLPADELAEPDGKVKKALAFRSGVNVDSLKWSASENEDSAWRKMLELVESNTTVPLKSDVKSATYFRLSNILNVSKGKTVQPTELQRSSGRGPVYGAGLKEGNQYQIKLSHHTLTEGPVNSGTAPVLPMKLELPTTSLQLTQPTLEVLGWYQTTPVDFKALRADDMYQALVIQVSKKKTGQTGTGADAQDAEWDIYLPIPLKVDIGWLYRLRTRWLPLLALALVLTAQSSINFLKDFFDKLLDGKATFSDLTKFWPVFLVLLSLGAVASIIVTKLKGSGKSDD